MEKIMNVNIAENSSLATFQQEFARHFSKKEAIEWAQKNSMPYLEMMTYFNCALMEIETKFKVINAEFTLLGEGNPIESIKTRLKSPGSLIKKIKKNNILPSPKEIEENIYDIAGVRVICSFEADIYKLADALIRQDDITLIERKDYIANPKPSGYRSLHLIVAVPIFLHNEKRIMNVEVQIRTLAMDLWASTEHKLRYKKEIKCYEPVLSEELRKCADMASELDNRLQALHAMIDGSGVANSN